MLTRKIVAVIASVAAAGALAIAAPAIGHADSSSDGGWTTSFYDDFNGTAGTGLDSNWQYDLGTGYPGGGSANWGTGEVETDTNSTANVFQDGSGNLQIKAINNGGWTSGRVESTDAFSAPAGGEMEMTARVQQPNPETALGYWPAFWALGADARPVAATNWPSIGELDVLEDVNGLSESSATFHCGVWAQPPCNEPNGIGSGLQPVAGALTGFHTYSVIVDRTDTSAEQLRFLVDDNVIFTVNESTVGAGIWRVAVDHGFNMILDLAIGGSYPDKVCGCYSAGGNPTSGAAMSVDYVAVYTKGGTASAPAPTGSATPTPSDTATPTPTPTDPVSTPTPTATPTPTDTPTPAPTATVTPTPTVTTAPIPGNGEKATPIPQTAPTNTTPSNLTLQFPSAGVTMISGTTTGIWGTSTEPVSVAIQDRLSGLWLQADGTFSATEAWLDAPTVDSAGTWRFMYTPASAGVYTVTASTGGTNLTSSDFAVE